MGNSVLDRDPSFWPNAPAPAAATHGPEADPPETVAAQLVVIDSERDSLYRDGVNHGSQSRWTEAERQAFLARAQRVDPRERRA